MINNARFANEACFSGAQRMLWYQRARGLSVSLGADGGLDYDLDSDDMALNTGGMHAPNEIKLRPGQFYYRFIGTRSARKFGMPTALAGGWWLDLDNYRKISLYAQDLGIALSEAAHRTLAIPAGWSDCHYVGRVLLNSPVRAYIGHGKPAALQSPHNSKRDKADDPVVLSPWHLQLAQVYVPGTVPVLNTAFDIASGKWKYCRTPGQAF